MNLDESNTSGATWIIGGVILIIGIIFLMLINPIVIIGTGQRGVVFSNGSGIEDRVLGEGVHLRIPFIESVNTMSVKVQKSDFKEDAASKDLQRITMEVTVNWQLVPSKVNKIYQTIGDNDTVVATVLNPRVQQAVKAQTSQYTAEEVQKNRDKLASEIQDLLINKMKGYDVIVTNVAITNLDYTAEFNAAIERKQLAQQEAEQAKYLKQKAEAEAAARIATANGDAQSRIINAKAEGEAQNALQQTLTPLLLQSKWIDAWKSGGAKVPTYMLGGDTNLLLDLKSIGK